MVKLIAIPLMYFNRIIPLTYTLSSYTVVAWLSWVPNVLVARIIVQQ